MLKKKLHFDDNNHQYFVFGGRFHVKFACKFVGIVENIRNLILFAVSHIPVFTVWCKDEDDLGCQNARSTIIWSLSMHGILVFTTITSFLLLVIGLRSDDAGFVKPYPIVHLLWVFYFLITSVVYMIFSNKYMEMYLLFATSLLNLPLQIWFFIVMIKCYIYLNDKNLLMVQNECSTINDEELGYIASGP